jgi:hypothetical protein
MRWYVTGWRWDLPMVYIWRLYIQCGVYTMQTMIYFMLLRQPRRYVWTEPLDGGAHCCSALFRSVTLKLMWLRLNGTMQQQRWHCGLELKGQWLSTHGTVWVVFCCWHLIISWWQCKFIISSHPMICLCGSGNFYKFTSACVALAILQVQNQRINSRTSNCSPLITNIFLK